MVTVDNIRKWITRKERLERKNNIVILGWEAKGKNLLKEINEMIVEKVKIESKVEEARCSYRQKNRYSS